MKKLKAWVISDTHGMHNQLIIPDVDVVIHCGDHSNYKDVISNHIEFLDFIDWYSALNINHKIMIAGNHDTSLVKKYNKEFAKEAGIIYLEDEKITIEGRNIYGSPWTPTFGDWNFMRSRESLGRHWTGNLEENIDVLITHGPPKGILDLSKDRDDNLEFCGDSALLKEVLRVKPKYNCFGHIHNSKDCINQGIRIHSDTTFVNASCVTDGKFTNGLSSNGLIIEI